MGQQRVKDMSTAAGALEKERPAAETKATVTKKIGKKKKIRKQVSTGHAYIQATYNNTIITFTDRNGSALTQCSAGQAGFQGPKKSTPYAAGIIVQKAVERAKPWGLKEVYVFVRGVGAGREAAIRALNANGINILGIRDVTPIPHNGCRARKPRRV